MALKPNGGALLSLSDRSKADAIPVIRRLHAGRLHALRHRGTAEIIRALGIPVEQVAKQLTASTPTCST